MRKINLGAGDVPLAGWENYDIKTGQDVRNLSLPDDYADICRASHVLEHLPHNDSEATIKEWVRVLKPGGWLKIAVPDFAFICKAYTGEIKCETKDGSPVPLASFVIGGQGDEYDYHKALFDEHRLRLLMESAGLVEVQRWESEIQDCASLPVSLNLMGRKPLPVIEHPVDLHKAEEQRRILTPDKPPTLVAPDSTCPKCGTSDPRTLEGQCLNCHPSRDIVPLEWDEKVNRFLKEARGVIHVGAHTGQERDVYAGYNLPVIWVEPLPNVYERLQAFIGRVPKQRAFQYLLTDKDGAEYDFKVANNDGQASSIFEFEGSKAIWPHLERVASVKLKSSTFKTMVERERIDLAAYDTLILDVQGAELLVLRGMFDLVKQFRWIRVEAADFPLYEGGCVLSEIDAYLTAYGFERREMFPALGIRGVGQTCEVLYVRRQSEPAKRIQVFAAGKWQDYREGMTLDVSSEEETELAKAGKLPIRVLELATTKANIIACMSVPRIGYLDTMQCVCDTLRELGTPLQMGFGVYWHHSLSRSIESALKWHSKDGSEADFVLTVDYDSIFTADQVKQMVRMMYEHPEADIIIPAQSKRANGGLLAGGTFDPNAELVPIDSGHFGLTLFRRSAFERLSKPWFEESPDENGDWGPGREDADIFFWRNARENGVKAYLAPKVICGHGEEVVAWPKLVDGKYISVYQPSIEWAATRKPPQEIAANA